MSFSSNEDPPGLKRFYTEKELLAGEMDLTGGRGKKPDDKPANENRTLYDRLQENKMHMEEEFAEKVKFSMCPLPLSFSPFSPSPLSLLPLSLSSLSFSLSRTYRSTEGTRPRRHRFFRGASAQAIDSRNRKRRSGPIRAGESFRIFFVLFYLFFVIVCFWVRVCLVF
jgi:hypothetical protein